jgi:hypothetical protein
MVLQGLNHTARCADMGQSAARIKDEVLAILVQEVHFRRVSL